MGVVDVAALQEKNEQNEPQGALHLMEDVRAGFYAFGSPVVADVIDETIRNRNRLPPKVVDVAALHEKNVHNEPQGALHLMEDMRAGFYAFGSPVVADVVDEITRA